MLANEMVEQLNEQINLEFFSSNLYLQMSAWCEDKGFEGAAEFLRAHAVEEMEHMQRLFTYVSETGAMPILVRLKHQSTN
ncbi:ferritin-like protein 2 [Vibrio astriarenae]|nr:ferritin-like protein 2 [Vibrio sp. C7]